MMREWDVAGRCCAGRGCGVLWREFSGGKSCNLSSLKQRQKPKIQNLTRSSDTFGHV